MIFKIIVVDFMCLIYPGALQNNKPYLEQKIITL